MAITPNIPPKSKPATALGSRIRAAADILGLAVAALLVINGGVDRTLAALSRLMT